MARKLKAFGVPYNPGIPYARDWSCPVCGWGYYTAVFDSKDDAVVGFTPEQPWIRSISEDITGILIIECPKDFTKFWFHTMRQEFGLKPIRKRIAEAEKARRRAR